MSMRGLFAWCLGGWLWLPFAALADETVTVCYHYDCAAQIDVKYSEAQLENVRQWLFYADDAATERRILASVMAKLYRWAGEQSPIHADKAGDYADDGVYGRMDCLDHTATTTRLLKMLEARGWLRFHRVIEPVRRFSALGLLQHFSAAMEELPGRIGPWRLSLGLNTRAVPGKVASEKFVVDTWFHDHGEPAEVMPLQIWLDGGGPNV